MSLNTVCIAGRLARDPITRLEDSGQQLTTWTLKVDEGQDNRPFTLFVPWKPRPDGGRGRRPERRGLRCRRGRTQVEDLHRQDRHKAQ